MLYLQVDESQNKTFYNNANQLRKCILGPEVKIIPFEPSSPTLISMKVTKIKLTTRKYFSYGLHFSGRTVNHEILDVYSILADVLFNPR